MASRDGTATIPTGIAGTVTSRMATPNGAAPGGGVQKSAERRIVGPTPIAPEEFLRRIVGPGFDRPRPTAAARPSEIAVPAEAPEAEARPVTRRARRRRRPAPASPPMVAIAPEAETAAMPASAPAPEPAVSPVPVATPAVTARAADLPLAGLPLTDPLTDLPATASPLAALATLPPPFDAEADDVLVCRQVRVETHDVKTFVFAPREPRLFRHKPGQFLTFGWPIGGETIQRCYTISSAPTRPDTVAITVKRVPGGPVSTWLHETMAPGMAVQAVGPMGDFTCLDHPAEKYLFLAGGSGITPLMSMSRTLHDLGSDADVVFVQAARSPADLIFRAELDLIARANPRFKVVHVVETDAGEPGWPGFRGRLSKAVLALAAPDIAEREAFTCGPAPFMAAVQAMLAEAGHPPARYHEESFAFEDLAPADREIADALPSTAPAFAVTFAHSGRTISCQADQTVLDAARLAGLRLPSSCTKGMCGTCKSRIVSGEVAMTPAGGIRRREIDAGLALLCCSRPLSDLVVER